MNLADARKTHVPKQRRLRVGRGRGSGRGKTSGRGGKGQSARSGWSRRLGFEGGQMPLVRRIPKRGFTNSFAAREEIVNVDDLAKFPAGTTVDLASLRAAGLVKGRGDSLKVLGRGELATALTVKARAFSASARAKIEGAGGKTEVV